MNAKLSTKYTVTKIPNIEISPQMIKKPQPKIQKLSEVINNNNNNNDDTAESDVAMKSNITEINEVVKPLLNFDYKLSLFLINSESKNYKKTAKRLDDYNYRRYNDNFWKSNYKPYNKLLISCIIGERLTELPIVKISSYMCKIIAFPNREPIIVYLPSMVHINTVKSSIQLVSVQRTKLTITLDIDDRSLSTVDIGSRQSVLAEALETDKDYNTSTNTNTNQDKNIVNQRNRFRETGAVINNDDDDELPEDKFHKKDATSSYIINQRDDQHKQKQNDRDIERDKHLNKEKDTDNNDDHEVEYIDVDKWKKDLKPNETKGKHQQLPRRKGRICPALVEMKEILKMSSTIWTELD